LLPALFDVRYVLGGDFQFIVYHVTVHVMMMSRQTVMNLKFRHFCQVLVFVC